MTSLAASIARKIGEGYDRPGGHSDLPIDINYARVAEWLVSICCVVVSKGPVLAWQYPRLPTFLHSTLALLCAKS